MSEKEEPPTEEELKVFAVSGNMGAMAGRNEYSGLVYLSDLRAHVKKEVIKARSLECCVICGENKIPTICAGCFSLGIRQAVNQAMGKLREEMMKLADSEHIIFGSSKTGLVLAMGIIDIHHPKAKKEKEGKQ